MISLSELAVAPFTYNSFDHNVMRSHMAAWRALSLLQRAPIRCDLGRRFIQTARSTGVPDFAFAFE